MTTATLKQIPGLAERNLPDPVVEQLTTMEHNLRVAYQALVQAGIGGTNVAQMLKGTHDPCYVGQMGGEVAQAVEGLANAVAKQHLGMKRTCNRVPNRD